MYDARQLAVEQIGAVLGWPHLGLSGARHDDAAGLPGRDRTDSH